jgi:uncharacterized repeat protein (TIGR04076 family)
MAKPSKGGFACTPCIFALRYGAEFPRLKDKDVSTHACPDAYNPVAFEIHRIPEE